MQCYGKKSDCPLFLVDISNSANLETRKMLLRRDMIKAQRIYRWLYCLFSSFSLHSWALNMPG
jgi:hypothetical protein